MIHHASGICASELLNLRKNIISVKFGGTDCGTVRAIYRFCRSRSRSKSDQVEPPEWEVFEKLIFVYHYLEENIHLYVSVINWFIHSFSSKTTNVKTLFRCVLHFWKCLTKNNYGIMEKLQQSYTVRCRWWSFSCVHYS